MAVTVVNVPAAGVEPPITELFTVPPLIVKSLSTFASTIAVPDQTPEVIVPTVASEDAEVTAFNVSRLDSIYTSKSVNATCFIVPPSLTTTRSASANVVLVAEVSPSIILTSAANAVNPKLDNAAAAVEAPVPPCAIATSVAAHVPPVTVPTVASEDADVTAFKVSRPASKYTSKSVNATCFIVPPSLTTTRSASASVVLVADVPPSMMFSSAAVELTPKVTNWAAAFASSNNALPAVVKS